jgi:hypothetical protein
MADEFDRVADVVVELEAALRQRHHARVDPVGDVDGVVGQQRMHRVAQQRGVVARQRCEHQHHRIVATVRKRVGEQALELEQPAERP